MFGQSEFRSQSLSHVEASSTFMQKVFMWMCGGLVLTGLISMQVASSEALLENIIYNRALFYGLIFAELGIVLLMSFMANRLSPTALALCFIAYSALNGVTLSVIFIVYSSMSIAQTFFITAGMFGGMAFYGWITQRDLTSIGSFLVMGLWGLILASIVNMFLHSSAFSYLISFVGVFIFLGLTAYDVQKLKMISAREQDETSLSKAVILGALTLYLDFINLFLMLLRLLGNRR